MEGNKDKYLKYKLKVLKYKYKATPSKVKNNKDIGFNINIAPATVIKNIYLYTTGKKAINTTIFKV
jgi:hypothetical protein